METHGEVRATVSDWLLSQSIEFHAEMIKEIVPKSLKCVDLSENYVKKKNRTQR